MAEALARWVAPRAPNLEASAALGAGPWTGCPERETLPSGWRRGLARALASGGVVRWSNPFEKFALAALGHPVPVAVLVRARPPVQWHILKKEAQNLALCLAEETVPVLLERDPLAFLQATSPSLTLHLEAWGRVARTNLPALLFGETGTGKEVVARTLHLASGRPGQFIAENCAAIPEGLLEAELFGVRRGAFTGAETNRRGRLHEARQGTLFLDEIGDLPLVLQVKLLRVLQEREVRSLGSGRSEPLDIRVLAATHRDLLADVEKGVFRRDLFYRLAGAAIEIPPLRERPGDVPFLAATLLARIEREGVGPGRFLSPRALALLQSAPWPGNVRELDNVLHRAAALSHDGVIGPKELITLCPRVVEPQKNLEAAAIAQALRLAGGVKAVAARHLGWTRQKLYRRIEALGLANGPNETASLAASNNLSSNRG